ncbi:hypothetical protein Tco_0981302 [Tanacetum coccineum]
MSIPYIIISSNSEDEGTDSSTTVLETEYDPEDFSYEDSSEENPSANKEDEPLSAQFTPTPPTQAAPTVPTSIIQPERTPLYRPYRLHPNRTHFMFTLRKTTRAPYTLPPFLEAAIVESIDAPPHKRT